MLIAAPIPIESTKPIAAAITITAAIPIEAAINEMQGKISLLDNRKFIRCAGVIGIYYVAWIGFLMHHILQTGGFR